MRTMSSLALRNCQHQDLDQILAIEQASFADSAYSRADFVYLIESAKGGFIVAEGNDHLMGYVVALSEGGTGIIQSIAVSPDLRRKGIGSALLKSAVDFLSELERIWLLVDLNNEAAISLYHRFSFMETGRIIKRYYRNGADAIEMVRKRATLGGSTFSKGVHQP